VRYLIPQKFGEVIQKVMDASISEMKKDLNQLLEKYDSKIIILIDDIDRLDKESMRLLFRLVRLNADFPNTIYVLAFDRQVVGKVLEAEQLISGREYLEKIIQVPFDLPLPEHSRIMSYLINEINKIIAEVSSEEWKENRWIEIYHQGFEQFFKTIRDVKRYINALRLTYTPIKTEVNSIDFIALEAIRIFCPEVYNDLSKNKDLLVIIDTYHYRKDGPREKEAEKAKLENIFRKSGDNYVEAVKRICINLFPKLSSIYGNTYHGFELEKGKKNLLERRI
jgi:predicted KAP-like P-loop ATPase